MSVEVSTFIVAPFSKQDLQTTISILQVFNLDQMAGVGGNHNDFLHYECDLIFQRTAQLLLDQEFCGGRKRRFRQHQSEKDTLFLLIDVVAWYAQTLAQF